MRKHNCVLGDEDEKLSVITRKSISEGQREDSSDFDDLFVTCISHGGPGDSMAP